MHVSTPLIMAPGRTEIRFDPLGVGLIIGAWNYPIMLSLSPLVAAIAGGNAAVIKPSEVSPACADAIARLVPQYLDTDAFSVVVGGVPETTALLAQQWDHIFFTGGPPIGKVVMAAAAKNLTPVVLELGGKNPTIVHDSADLRVAARRIAQGRWMNAGQTCTAPDHVLVFRSVAKDFLEQLKEAVVGFYGADPQNSPDYGRIVNARHFDRLTQPASAAARSTTAASTTATISSSRPTILVERGAGFAGHAGGGVRPDPAGAGGRQRRRGDRAASTRSPPRSASTCSPRIADVSHGFSTPPGSGDAAVNDCTVQPLVRELPFGGVGNSGMGKYHGEWGFRAYTNARGVLYHSTMLDPGVRYPPYSEHERLRGLLARLS